MYANHTIVRILTMKTTKETTITRKKNDQQKELFGRTFRIVKNGLDEEEIVSFLARLIEQNTELVAKLEQLDSLKKLAENTVIEAQNEAKRIKFGIEQDAKEMASAMISEAKAAAEKNAKKKIEEAERIAEAMQANAEEEAKRIKDKAIQEAEELAEKIRATVYKETKNSLRIKKELFKKHYKQIYKELVSDLVSMTEIASPSTGNVSTAPQDLKQKSPHIQLAARRTEAILRLKQFATGPRQYFLRFLNLLTRWLKRFYRSIYPILQSTVRRVRKAASRLKELIPHLRLTY